MTMTGALGKDCGEVLERIRKGNANAQVIAVGATITQETKKLLAPYLRKGYLDVNITRDEELSMVAESDIKNPLIGTGGGVAVRGAGAGAGAEAGADAGGQGSPPPESSLAGELAKPAAPPLTAPRVHHSTLTFGRTVPLLRRVTKSLSHLKPKSCLVFVRTSEDAIGLSASLSEKRVKNILYTGGTLSRRQLVARSRIDRKTASVVVCTGIAARGLDIKHLTHVINAHPPENLGDYVHRAGRVGRLGQLAEKAEVVTLVNPEERTRMEDFAKLSGVSIVHREIKVERSALPERENDPFQK